ncbi:MAG TPA: PqiC family protein [Thermoanaerobaculia bacterium]
MTIRRTALLLVCLLLGGCGFLKRPPNQFYSLQTIPATAAVPAVGGVPVGIDGIELPPGLDRRGIVLRGADHRFEVRGTHQWAAPLEEMVIHTLAFDLANRMPEGMVVLPGQAKPATMRSLFIVFEDLAPGPDNVFVLDARWTIGELTRHERITVNLQSTESASIVAAMSQALGTLADRIVAAL